MNLDVSGFSASGEFNLTPPMPGSITDAEALRAGDASEVLIVDDVTMTAFLTQAMLAKHGMASTIAYGGAEALRWLGEHRASVVLCDISMPGMSGIDVAKEVHARWPEDPPKLIAFTAYTREHEQRALLEAGFDDYIAKPVRADKLAMLIKKWMD